LVASAAPPQLADGRVERLNAGLETAFRFHAMQMRVDVESALERASRKFLGNALNACNDVQSALESDLFHKSAAQLSDIEHSCSRLEERLFA
jgi:hypothetical protein